MYLDLAGGCADRGGPRSLYRADDGGAHPEPPPRHPLAGALPLAGGCGLAGRRGVAGRTEAAATFKHRLDYTRFVMLEDEQLPEIVGWQYVLAFVELRYCIHTG